MDFHFLSRKLLVHSRTKGIPLLISTPSFLTHNLFRQHHNTLLNSIIFVSLTHSLEAGVLTGEEPVTPELAGRSPEKTVNRRELPTRPRSHCSDNHPVILDYSPIFTRALLQEIATPPMLIVKMMKESS
ncbi:uncharacterized protein LOC118485799 [Helianthus annuus]|uniref:uncharacterized protein LOC118485799 n=1 Tax=Helianthus annuus TaxID=4232 RepID=UPI0016531C92|nr:uncharacterized protein LOC118485799 [Helianthus annuus]